MAFIDRLVEFVSPGYAARKIAEAIPASGAGIDPDDDLYRRLTGGTRDLSPIDQKRSQDIALYLWRKNPMARRLTEMLTDFVVGDGITFEAEDEDVKEVMDEFWQDPKMALHARHRDLIRDQSIYGELAFESLTNETLGRTRLRFIDPGRIKDVRPNPENAFEDALLVLNPPKTGEDDVRIPIATFDDEQDPTQPVWTGSGLYMPVNRVTGQHRGVPDLLALADFIDGYDQLLFNALERSGLINAFVWDVTLTGATEQNVTKWVQDHGSAPPPGSVRAHNEKETWQAVAPTLGNADLMALGRPVKNMALGGFGAPEAWFAEGDSANRATLAAQGDPTYRMITARQTVVGAQWTTLFGFVIGKAVEFGRLPVNVDRDFRIILPEPSTADTGTLATALTALAQSLVAAEDQEWLSKKTARSIFATVASGLGIEIDPDEEEMKAEQEAEEADEEAAEKGLPTSDQMSAMRAQAATVPPGAPSGDEETFAA